MKNLALALVSAAFLASCASEGANVAMDPKPEAVYQTGSNIPKKSTGAVTVDRETLERSQELNFPTMRSGKGG